jgi:hypothetical protein
MNQDESKESIKETFNVSLDDREILPAKNNTKIKLAIAIISTVLVLAATTTLLISYFKFDWFKNEIYNVDANLTREINQANFFQETKKINTRIAITKDEYEEQEYTVNTNFMVYLKKRIQLKENDYLNTATIVITKSKMTTKGQEYDLPSFDLTDENKVREFEKHPDGSKNPIAEFSYFENGTIADIKFADLTDEYNTQTLKELIEKVTPKLSRNRTEDNENGLNIKTRTDRKKKTLIEEEKPRQYYDFKGSKFTKSVERDFEDDKLTDIRTKSDIHLQALTGEEDEQVFGATDFYFKSESNINSYEFDGWINVDYRPGNGRGRSGGSKGGIIFCLPNKINTYSLTNVDTQEQSSDILGRPPLTAMRNLYSISADQTFNIGKYNILGQSLQVQYHVAVKNGNPINEIIIKSNLGTATIGNSGFSLSGGWSSTINIFSFAFPAFPLVSLNAKAKGSISWSVSVKSGSGSSVKLSASLSGKITLGCEVKAGWDPIVSFAGGVEGVIVNASGSATIENKKVTKNFSISGGQIYVYLDRSILGSKERVAQQTLYNGW